MNSRLYRIVPLVAILAQGCESRSPSHSRLDTARSDKCQSDSIKELSVPLEPSHIEPSFNLKIEHHPASSDQPTVIFLPGGPGGTSIGKKHAELPASYGFINTDPRSVGCNESPDPNTFSDDVISTAALANDVAMIVKGLSLSNYIIYGQSYGTLLATVSAKRIEELKLPSPKAIVVEGTVGKAFESLDEMNSEFVHQWKLIKDTMPVAMRNKIDANQLPFGMSSDELGRSVKTLMVIGSQQGVYLADLVFERAASEDANLQAWAKIVLTSTKNPSLKDAAAERLYRLIACKEIAPGNNDDLKIIDGKIFAANPDLCGELRFGPNRFDAKNIQLKTPIFYFNGARDPATPLAQMQYHYDSQQNTRKTKIIIPNAGHGPIGFSLSACMPQAWGVIDGSKPITSLRDLLAPCVADVTVETNVNL